MYKAMACVCRKKSSKRIEKEKKNWKFNKKWPKSRKKWKRRDENSKTRRKGIIQICTRAAWTNQNTQTYFHSRTKTCYNPKNISLLCIRMRKEKEELERRTRHEYEQQRLREEKARRRADDSAEHRRKQILKKMQEIENRRAMEDLRVRNCHDDHVTRVHVFKNEFYFNHIFGWILLIYSHKHWPTGEAGVFLCLVQSRDRSSSEGG